MKPSTCSSGAVGGEGTVKNVAIKIIKQKGAGQLLTNHLECGAALGEQVIVIIKLEGDRGTGGRLIQRDLGEPPACAVGTTADDAAHMLALLKEEWGRGGVGRMMNGNVTLQRRHNNNIWSCNGPLVHTRWMGGGPAK